MTRIIYVNGRYQDYANAVVHAEDRGFQFADSVYEVCEVREGRLIDERRHMARLLRSLAEVRMTPPMGLEALGVIMRETVRRNRVRDGLVYLQVTRGAAHRDFAFPAPSVPATVVCIARSLSGGKRAARAARGIAVKTMPDIRWKKPHVKTTGLLPNVLARQAAKDAGANEAWLVDENGFVTEGAACNAWIVDARGILITRQADDVILRGVTREVVMTIAGIRGIKVVERPFTVAEAKAAQEAFITGAAALVTPVVEIDGEAVGGGAPGELTKELRRVFHDFAGTTPPARSLTRKKIMRA
jgi:D-alanine transaminase